MILKDELLPKSPNGREQSTVSWEYDFKGEKDGGKRKVFVKWDELKPTYRGREKKDAKPLDLKNVKRISLMIRRYFRYAPCSGSKTLTCPVFSEHRKETSLCPSRQSLPQTRCQPQVHLVNDIEIIQKGKRSPGISARSQISIRALPSKVG